MRNSITVMNAKGGVGKTTFVLTLAETLSAYFGKKVLVVDSDAHASLSTMLLPGHWLESIQEGGRTFVDYVIAAVLKKAPMPWHTFVVSGVSDVDDARSIDLMLGGGHLTLFEREVSKGNHEGALRLAIRAFLAEARDVYEASVARAWAFYRELTDRLIPVTRGILGELWHLDRRKNDAFGKNVAKEAEKKAIETARYVLPIACHTAMVYTVSGLVLHRLRRMAGACDVPDEARAVVAQMLACVEKVDPAFFTEVGEPVSVEWMVAVM